MIFIKNSRIFIFVLLPLLVSAGENHMIGPDVWVFKNSVIIGTSDTLTVLPGTIVKFHLKKGMTVLGSLRAKGTQLKPIFFTSFLDDSKGGDTDKDGGLDSPMPGEWGPIQFGEQSRIELAHSCFSYLAGPMNVRSNYAQIDSCYFNHCGFSYFNGVDRSFNVTGIALSYLYDAALRPKPDANAKGQKAGPKTFFTKRNMAFSIASVAGLAAGGYFLYSADRSRKKYNAYKPGNPAFEIASAEERNRRFQTLRSQIIRDGVVGSCLAAAGLTGIGVTVIYTIHF